MNIKCILSVYGRILLHAAPVYRCRSLHHELELIFMNYKQYGGVCSRHNQCQLDKSNLVSNQISVLQKSDTYILNNCLTQSFLMKDPAPSAQPDVNLNQCQPKTRFHIVHPITAHQRPVQIPVNSTSASERVGPIVEPNVKLGQCQAQTQPLY